MDSLLINLKNAESDEEKAEMLKKLRDSLKDDFLKTEFVTKHGIKEIQEYLSSKNQKVKL